MGTAHAERQALKQYGKLTIFASYGPGAGKTYAMLQAVQRDVRTGRDAVVGFLRPDDWPQTLALTQSLERLPGCENGDIDLDRCLARKPQLFAVDDLARRNGDGARHRKRYQDVDELLKAGIDVYATLDVQHIESLQDTAAAILGAPLAERIPDRVFDRAAQVVLIDVEPETLRERFSAHRRDGLTADLSPARLSALRELALRRCADRAALSARGARNQTEYRTHEHILACLSSAPSNARIIRTAARMAAAFHCDFTALFVETGQLQTMSEPDKERLRSNVRLAQQLGAVIETVYGDDVAYQIAEFSRLSGVTKIVLGRGGISDRTRLYRTSLTERLVSLTPDLDIHIIPDANAGTPFSAGRGRRIPPASLSDLLKSACILVAATLIGSVFYQLGFTEPNIITLYILGVMLVSVFTKSPLCSLLASGVGVLTFNFFFTEPRFSLLAYDSGYPVTFLVMFLASFITGSLAAQLKAHAKRSAQVAWRTKLLLETNQNLQKAKSTAQVLGTTAQQLVKIFERDIVIYPADGDRLGRPCAFYVGGRSSENPYIPEKERLVAQWVLKNNKRAGAGTETLANARYTYLSIRKGEQVYGVVGIEAVEKALDPFERSILLSVLGECALALENQKNREAKEAAAVLAKNEQLRADLLRSISHDLRTPLTSISGNASNLLSNEELLSAPTKKQMYLDIYDDAMWLISLVENLLSASRLKNDRMDLRLSTELMDDVVAEALRHVNRKSAEYRLHVQSCDEYLLAQIDARLIVQVLINLIDNAVKYTPPGSEIDISWKRQQGYIYVSVADNGPGIADHIKPHVFEMFYSASDPVADSRRSMGLGLALCKSIIHAHGGEITVTDRSPHGAVFTFSVPAGEVELHE